MTTNTTNTTNKMNNTTQALALNHLIELLPPAPHLRLLRATAEARHLLEAIGAFAPASAGVFQLLKREMENAGFEGQCPFVVLLAGHCPASIVKALRVRFA